MLRFPKKKAVRQIDSPDLDSPVKCDLSFERFRGDLLVLDEHAGYAVLSFLERIEGVTWNQFLSWPTLYKYHDGAAPALDLRYVQIENFPYGIIFAIDGNFLVAVSIVDISSRSYY